MESVATGSWWKVVKRVLALLRLKNKEKTPLYKGLLEILNGETGRFAQIVGDTDLLAYLVENESVMTDERVKASLDAMIDRLQKLPSIPEVWTPKITEKIQRLTASVSSGFGYREFREEIDNLRDYFEKILNTRTHRVLVDKDLITPIQNTLK